MTKNNLPAATTGLLLAILTISPCLAQETDSGQVDSLRQESQPIRRWGVGGQLSPVLGLSVRYTPIKQLTVQVAGLPFLVGGETTVGARLLINLYIQPKYTFYASGGGTLFIDTENYNVLTEEDEGTSTRTLVFATLGGEYRFAQRLGLSGELGFGYFERDSPFIEGGTTPLLGLGLHYYF